MTKIHEYKLQNEFTSVKYMHVFSALWILEIEHIMCAKNQEMKNH